MTSSELPVFVHSSVVRGFGRGSKQLGCPTANVASMEHPALATGIYCGLAQLVIQQPGQLQQEPGQQQAYSAMLQRLPFVSAVKPMVCSFGYNPQFANAKRSLEVHILDKFQFNFYGAELRTLICKKMREEEKYNSLEELKAAIANDIEQAGKLVRDFQHHAQDPSFFLAVPASTHASSNTNGHQPSLNL